MEETQLSSLLDLQPYKVPIHMSKMKEEESSLNPTRGRDDA